MLTEERTEITDIECSTEIVKKAKEATKEPETDERVDTVDSHRLAQLIATKQFILARWRSQRTKRKLHKKVSELKRENGFHSRLLCSYQWIEACNVATARCTAARSKVC